VLTVSIYRRLFLLLLTTIFLAGCSGVTPYEPRNNREEGPENGLFSGPGGVFVISPGVSKKDETEPAEQPKKP
jgi:hypothetical protein